MFLQKILISVCIHPLSVTHCWVNFFLQVYLVNTLWKTLPKGKSTSVMAHTELEIQSVIERECDWTQTTGSLLRWSLAWCHHIGVAWKFRLKLAWVWHHERVLSPHGGTLSLWGCCLMSYLAPISSCHVGQPTSTASWHDAFNQDFTEKYAIVLIWPENEMPQYKRLCGLRWGK